MHLLYDPAIPLLRIQSRGQKTYVHTKTYACKSIDPLFILFQTENNPNTHQSWYIHPMEYYSKIKMNTHNNMGKTQMIAERRQTERTTYSMIQLICTSRKVKTIAIDSGQGIGRQNKGAGKNFLNDGNFLNHNCSGGYNNYTRLLELT